MRALLALLGILGLLLLPAASAAPADRLSVTAAYPGPGAQVVLYEDADCATHELLWQGGWFTVADAAWWARHVEWGAPEAMLPSLTSVGSLTNHPLIAGFGLVAHGEDLALQAKELAPEWAHGNASASEWGLGALGDEDVCVLSLVSVTSGL
ncbi:MAG: hypothetical protein LC624_06695 [Halobacteriales archaeon]|nr:hypothetical protein [Halobacteriales archaeon]